MHLMPDKVKHVYELREEEFKYNLISSEIPQGFLLIAQRLNTSSCE